MDAHPPRGDRAVIHKIRREAQGVTGVQKALQDLSESLRAVYPWLQAWPVQTCHTEREISAAEDLLDLIAALLVLLLERLNPAAVSVDGRWRGGTTNVSRLQGRVLIFEMASSMAQRARSLSSFTSFSTCAPLACSP